MQNLNLDFFFHFFLFPVINVKNVCLSAIQKKPAFFISQIANSTCRMFLMFRLVICLTVHDLHLKEIVLKMYRRLMYTRGVSLSVGTHTPCLYMNAHMGVYIYFYFTNMHPFFVHENKQYM